MAQRTGSEIAKVFEDDVRSSLLLAWGPGANARRDCQKLRILIIGAGGREHALAWKLEQSPRVDQIFVAPGTSRLTRSKWTETRHGS